MSKWNCQADGEMAREKPNLEAKGEVRDVSDLLLQGSSTENTRDRDDNLALPWQNFQSDLDQRISSSLSSSTIPAIQGPKSSELYSTPLRR